MKKILLIFSLIFLSFSCLAKSNFENFAKLPILNEGKVKPIDSLAKSYLFTISGKKSLAGFSANEWFAEVVFQGTNVYKREIFAVNNNDLLVALGLDKKKLFSFYELEQAFWKNRDLISSIYEVRDSDLTLMQTQIIDLHIKVIWFYNLSKSLSIILPKYNINDANLARSLNIERGSLFSYLDFLQKRDLFLSLAKESKALKDDGKFLKLLESLREVESEKRVSFFPIIPNIWSKRQDDFKSIWEIIEEGLGSPESMDYISLWQDLAFSYYSQDFELFEDKAAQILEHEILNKNIVRKLALEVDYNNSNIFFHILILLGLACIFANFSKFRIFAQFSIGVASLFSLLVICIRIYLNARPPVSSLYESIIFVCFIVTFLSFLMSFKYKESFVIMVGAVVGLVLNYVAIEYSVSNNELGVISAVLNNNFWLTTHVLTISVGYALCLFASSLAHIYLINQRFAIFRSKFKLHNLIFILSIAALLFVTTGTILGGIWADQSWGRFWGWDPKENGALLIILWLVLLIHARLANMIGELLFNFSMVVTNIIVIMAWYGVNLLNVGFHSYGFTENIAFNIFLFSSLELIFIFSMGYLIWQRQR